MVGTRASLALICGFCGDPQPDPLAWRCPRDRQPYELVDPLRPGQGNLDGQGVWRYRDWLPAVEPVTLGEPTTPLLTLPWPTGQAIFKLEPSQPTGSFKDRASALLVGWLRTLGINRVAEDSSGNAGASLAAYTARAGIACDIFVPASASPGKLTQIAAYGARVLPIEGVRQAAADAAARSTGAGTVYATHLWNPLCLAGTATWAFEVWEQLGGVPDAIVMPLGAGTLLLGAARAFEAMRLAGLIDREPRVFGVQTTACAPLAIAAATGSEDPAPVQPAAGAAAEGIMLAKPPRGREILRRTAATGGSIVAVDDEPLWSALATLARHGVYVEPTSAVAAAGLDLLRGSGRIRPHERVVVALTGSGLKAGDRIRAQLLAG